MDELTTVEERLAEVLGLAQAAQGATEVIEVEGDDEVVLALRQMREQARRTERRCATLADARRGKRTAILDRARKTRAEATRMMQVVDWAVPSH